MRIYVGGTMTGNHADHVVRYTEERAAVAEWFAHRGYDVFNPEQQFPASQTLEG